MSFLLIGLLILVVLLVMGMPVPFCFFACVAFIIISTGLDPSCLLAAGFWTLNSLTLLAAPLFIILGMILSMGKENLASRLVDFLGSIGRWRGNTGTISVVACAVAGAITGTCSAALAAIGTVMIPQMDRQGYTRGYSTALVTCSSVLGQLIPPSVPMILYAWATEQSVAACFLATVLPGILLVVIYSIFHQLFTLKMPNVQPVPKSKGYWRVFARAASRASLVLLLPLLVLGSIYGGFATPSESASVGIIFALILICAVYRQANVRNIANILVKGTTLAGALVIMVFFIMILSRIFSLYNIPTLLASAILGLSSNKYLVLLMLNEFHPHLIIPLPIVGQTRIVDSHYNLTSHFSLPLPLDFNFPPRSKA